MIYSFDSYSDIGKRDVNEDTYSIDETNDYLLFMVADGLGGHDNGDIASLKVINDIKSYLNNDINEAIEYANRELYQLNQIMHKSMYTTISSVYITKNKTYLAYVGDTRIYAFKDNHIVYQSLDHSVSQIAVLVGEIEQKDIRSHSDRNQLTRVLGSSDKIKVDVKELSHDDYDAILLCSDGFWEYVLEEDMCKTLSESMNANDWLYRMKRILNTHISKTNDNNTAIVYVKGDD